MKVDVLLGLQWGDEGKGKIVDVITPDYNVIARFQGGPNAGHTLIFNNQKHVLHTIPSGIFREGSVNVIGNGVVIDPVIFKTEIDNLRKFIPAINQRLVISKKAHLIVPTHRILDAASEAAKGKEKIGSTLKGIGPAYMDKTGRNGLRVGDIDKPDFLEKYKQLCTKHKRLLMQYDFEYDLDKFEKDFFDGIEMIKEFATIDCEHEVNKFLTDGKKVLAEGAQGTLLDVEYGTYPFVTSSNTISAGACTGLGIAPSKIGEVMGIFKSYCTRVGSGPFPSELLDENGEKLQRLGHEIGSTTGRARRCGWLDLPALKYAVMINGVTQLHLTKADVLDHFDTIKLVTSYNINGESVDYFPYDLSGDPQPVLKEFKGWKRDTSSTTNFDDLPQEMIDYINYIESEIKVPIKLISVGPDRNQTIFR